MAQATDVKAFVKGMNKDVDPRFLQPGEYVDAQNIMLSNYREGRAGGVTNFPGLQSRLGLATTLGLFKDELNDNLYIFEYASASVLNIKRYALSSGSVTTLLSTSVLPWTASTIIKSARLIEGILIWTDGDKDIGMFNTNITYPTPYVAEMFTLAQTVPQNKPGISPEIDGDYGYNNIIGKFFQFKIRFIFLGGHKSVFSPISEVAYTHEDYASPESIASKPALVNSIVLSLDGTGATEMVEKIEIAGRTGNNGDFFSIATIDADSTFQAGGAQSYTFYNESLYDPIALDESNQLYDDVPLTAQALEIGSNRVILGDVLTGYDKVAVDYDLEVEYADQTDPEPQRVDSDFDFYDVDPITYPSTRYGFNNSSEFSTMMTAQFGAPVAGNTVTVSGKSRTLGGAPVDYSYPFGYASYEIQTGDSWANQVWNALVTPQFWASYAGVYLDLHDISTNNAPPPTGNDAFVFTYSENQHEKTFKSGAWYSVGIQYFDDYGRTNGVQFKENSRIYIETIGERGLTQDDYTRAGAATIKVTINSAPPSWATYYKIVYSRATVNEFVLQIATRGATSDGVNKVLLNIGSIAEWNDEKGGNLGYIWEKGDRVKILTYDQGGTDIYKDWAQNLIDAEIINDDSTGDYSISIPAILGLSGTATVLALNTGALIEIYRPSKELDESDSLFTEASPSYAISGGYHLGDVNQTAVVDAEVTITGDAYIKSREDFPYGAGATPSYAGIGFESYDISDYRESEHYDKGRPTAIINQEQSQKSSTLMYSEFIIPNTDINNLNRFYPDVNYEEYEKQFGKIKLLHSEADHLLMLQEDRASKVYLNRQMMYDGQGSGQLIGTQQKILSQAVPYAGIYGIHDWRSFQAVGNRRYWLDAARGVAVRLSANGIEEISRYGMRGYFAEQCHDLMDSVNDVVRSVYDVQNDMYLLHLDGENTTVVFDEKTNAWVSFVNFITAEHSAYINNRSFVIEGGDLYEMNNYSAKNTGTGSAQSSYLQFPSNIEPTDLKNFMAIHLDSSHALDVAITTEAIDGGTDQSSSLDRTLDFTKREQEWHASFLRDANTPNVTNPLLEGDTLKGKHAKITLTLPAAVGDEDFTMKLAKIVVSKG
jgi:hypothetical protein